MNPSSSPDGASGAVAVASPDSSGTTDRASLIDVLLLLAAHLRLLIVLPLASGVLALGLTYLVTPVFTASTQLMTPQQSGGTAAALLGSLGGATGALGGGLAGLKNPSDQWIGLLRSRVVADAIVQRFKLREVYQSEFQFQARDTLAVNTRIVAGRDGLIDLEVDDTDRERAARIVATYVEELQRLSNTLAVTEAAQRRVFFQKRLTETKEALVKAEIALREGGISANVLKTSPEAAVTQLAQAQAALAAQEVKLSVMRGAMTELNPEYRQAQRELASLREQLRRAEQDQPGQARSDSAQYVARYRDFKYYETLFELFARQYELARADEAKDGALVQVVDPVQVPEHKSRPRRGLIAVVVTGFALVLTIAGLLAMDGLRRYRQRPEGAEKLDLLRRRLRGRSGDR